MTDLATWLREQLDHDEQVARAAIRRRTTSRRMIRGVMTDVIEQPDPSWRRSAWPPERVLRQVAAHRAILAAYESFDDRLGYVQFGDWESCGDSCAAEVVRRAVLAISVIYADRDGYDPAWAAE